MVGKTFKGLTDELLTWQTARLLELEVGRKGIVVEVRPELVVEVALDGAQASSRYPGGVALRFARVRGSSSSPLARSTRLAPPGARRGVVRSPPSWQERPKRWSASFASELFCSLQEYRGRSKDL